MHNIDLSDVVHGHMDYEKQLNTIMKAVGVRTRDEIKPKQSQSAPVTPSHSEHGLLIREHTSHSAPVSRSETYQNIGHESQGKRGAIYILKETPLCHTQNDDLASAFNTIQTSSDLKDDVHSFCSSENCLYQTKELDQTVDVVDQTSNSGGNGTSYSKPQTPYPLEKQTEDVSRLAEMNIKSLKIQEEN